jgi:hypothetical protein
LVEFRDVQIARELWCSTRFCLLLSHWRIRAVVWSLRKDQLAGTTAQQALRRLGLPAVIGVDDEKRASIALQDRGV